MVATPAEPSDANPPPGHRRGAGQRGAAMVEFAIVLPVLVMLAFGIVEFGRGYNTRITLTAAAREGARVLALGGTAADVSARVKASAPSLDPNLIVVETRRIEPTPAVTIVPPCTAGTVVEVRASYSLAYDIPLVRGGTWNMLGLGVMRCGG